ncbi:MAG TPA: hypothetical protein VJR02_23115 [Pyrinomonadaceae bacterium]|nr:hypothetical protein [Pyrinomonadaceae bacterium]
MLVLYYVSPALLGLAIVIVSNYQRVRKVQKYVVTQVCQQLDRQNSANEPQTAVPDQLQKIINVIKANGWSNCQQGASLNTLNLTAPQYIQSNFFTAWSANSAMIAILTLFPFSILGVGLARKYYSVSKSSRVLGQAFSTEEKAEHLRYRLLAFKDFILKTMVAFVIAFGWLYIFNPHGQAASAINDWLGNTNVMANDTTPNFFNFKDSSLKHGLTAVFGWYLYLLGYFFYRFYKSDVLGTRVYNVLFKKFLFVVGVAFIMSSVGANSNESLLLIFLIGFFPLSAVTLLTEFGNKRLSVGEDQTSLSILPGMSTWQILRLEEEGIDSLSTLANANAATLKVGVSSEVISPEMLDTWIDQSRLITVIGTRRWTELNGICEGASEFVKKQHLNDPAFINKLAEKSIFNADEIAATLRKNFKIGVINQQQLTDNSTLTTSLAT